VLERRALATLFQPIFSFGEARVLGFEALVRGPEGSAIETPFELFGAAEREGRLIELNIVCIQEVLRAFARRSLPGLLFLNISPQLIVQKGFDQSRAARFLESLGVEPRRVVIELTEDASFDFALVHDSLMLYRAMGFRVAIDDLGEGFSSLRLWSELSPEFVKADKHFVTGIAHDAVKLQFLRAIQHIAESSGASVIAEGIESGDDFRLVKELGIALGQGWFIGRPEAAPRADVSRAAAAANGDERIRVPPMTRLRPGSEPRAGDFLRAVEPVDPATPLCDVAGRFSRSTGIGAIPVAADQGVEGVASRAIVEPLAVDPRHMNEPIARYVEGSPIRADAELDLPALAAMLVEADSRRLADGFVILSHGRYVGMGRSQDVIRALQGANAFAARHMQPLSLLPGQVPMHEHLDRLLARRLPFSVWVADIDEMAGLNDAEGFPKGDALIHATARLLERACDAGIDFAAHVSGTRFVVLAQSDDWRERSARVVAGFRELLAEQVSGATFARGYFTAESREGRRLRPLPRLVVGILPVLPGVFESRHDVLLHAKAANGAVPRGPASALYVDERRGNAYPQSYLLAPG
jgi:EAL domain-containing protein (putative c-di-GMP-specific phosphodiesterase class I)/GGDEF domain-containing protein